MFKNTASQAVTLLAIDTATGLPKTGDAGNITFYYNGDAGGPTIFSTSSGHPAEDSSTLALGCYTLALTQGETNYNRMNFTGVSTSSGIKIIPMLNVQMVPSALGIAAGASGGLFIAGTNASLAITGTTAFNGSVSILCSSGGDALTLQATSGNASGLNIIGIGSSPGIRCIGGATGNGINILGGPTSGVGVSVTTTSGDGISITPTAGNAIVATANGTSKHGVLITGGTAGTSDGLKLVAGSGGVGARLDTLTASGAVTLSSTLTVSGATTFTGAVTGTNASNDLRINGVVPGAAGGVLIAGANAATTFVTLTSTGAFSINGTSNVAQTGDSFARLGAAGAGLTALGDTRIANLDATVSSRLATSGYTVPPTAAANATAVWQDTTAGDFTAAGSIGKSLGGAFTSLGTSVYSTASLANAPTGGSAPTANQNADALLDRAAGVETAMTPRQALRLMLAILAGKISISGTTVTIRDTGDTKNRVVAVCDTAGERTTVTLDAS